MPGLLVAFKYHYFELHVEHLSWNVCSQVQCLITGDQNGLKGFFFFSYRIESSLMFATTTSMMFHLKPASRQTSPSYSP